MATLIVSKAPAPIRLHILLRLLALAACISFNHQLGRPSRARSWGSSVLTYSKGTWVCDAWTGAGATDTAGKSHSYIFNVAKGTGDYEGLVMDVQWHFVEAVSAMVPPSLGIAISGWIERAK